MYTRQATPESQGCGSYSTSAETDPKPYTASNKTEVPQSVKGAPEHLRASIRKRQNSQSAKRTRERRKAAAKEFRERFEIQCRRVKELEEQMAALVEMVRKKRQREQLESQDSATTANPTTTTTKLSENEIDDKKGSVEDPNGVAPTLHCVVQPSETQCQPQKYMGNADFCNTPSPNTAFPSNNQHNHPSAPTQLNSLQQPNQKFHSEGTIDKNFLTSSSIAPLSGLQSEAGKLASNDNLNINNIYNTPLTRVENTGRQTGAVDTNSFNQAAGINDCQKLIPIFSDLSDMSSNLNLLDF